MEGWTEQSKKRRQAEFDAGQKTDLRIEELKVRRYSSGFLQSLSLRLSATGHICCFLSSPNPYPIL